MKLHIVLEGAVANEIIVAMTDDAGENLRNLTLQDEKIASMLRDHRADVARAGETLKADVALAHEKHAKALAGLKDARTAVDAEAFSTAKKELQRRQDAEQLAERLAAESRERARLEQEAAEAKAAEEAAAGRAAELAATTFTETL